jgi:hypothetical protein
VASINTPIWTTNHAKHTSLWLGLRGRRVVCLLAAPVSAQPLDKRTLFTFSGPVTLSGVTLPGGQYLFRLADPNSSSNPFDYVGVRHAGSLFTRNAWRTRATARR